MVSTLGKRFRQGTSLIEATKMFTDDDAAQARSMRVRRPRGPACPEGGSTNVQTCAAHEMPIRCRERRCRRRFSVRYGTVMQSSKLGYQVWAMAIYLCLTSLKSVSSMKLRSELNIARAQVVERTDKATIHGFVAEHTDPEATVYSDEAAVHASLPNPHEAVSHKRSEYIRGDIRTNGVESFWSMLRRAHKGTFHKMSLKHLNRYVREFAAKHNLRDLDTLEFMGAVVTGMNGKQREYDASTAPNGLDSGVRC